MVTKTTTETWTCQVCGRTVKAGNGLIAHHGYQRPYQAGWQSASCLGARYAPYEVSCERLREVTGMVKDFIATQEQALADFLVNPPQTLVVYEHRSSWDREGTRVEYTRPDDFNLKNNYQKYVPRTYGCTYDTRKSDYERTIKMAQSDLSTMERRLNEWKPVHPCITHKNREGVYVFEWRSNNQPKQTYFCEECAKRKEYKVFNQPLTSIVTHAG
jgi:hypothetical protein